MQHLIPRRISRYKSLWKTVYLHVRNTDTVHSLQWNMETLHLFMFHYNNVRNVQLALIKFEQERKHKLPQPETVKWVHYLRSFANIIILSLPCGEQIPALISNSPSTRMTDE